jgi:hypothetical protein
MEDAFKLTRRKGSNKWQVRKRWPLDVAATLPGEFNASTGEEDKQRAQEQLLLIAAEYTRRVREARVEKDFLPIPRNRKAPAIERSGNTNILVR